MIHNGGRRLRDGYEASARIISATALDGSALDALPELDRCAPGEDCQSLPLTGDWRSEAARRAVEAAIARDGADTGSDRGGNGSGGIYPFAGGLPGHIPEPFKYFALAACIVAGVVLLGARRR